MQIVLKATANDGNNVVTRGAIIDLNIRYARYLMRMINMVRDVSVRGVDIYSMQIWDSKVEFMDSSFLPDSMTMRGSCTNILTHTSLSLSPEDYLPVDISMATVMSNGVFWVATERVTCAEVESAMIDDDVLLTVLTEMSGPNEDTLTGVHYGVISCHALKDWVIDKFRSEGLDIDFNHAWEEYQRTTSLDYDTALETFRAKYHPNDDSPLELEVDGMQLVFYPDTQDVWVYKSMYVMRCNECSPCAPGAGDLSSRSVDGVETYDLPPTWYADV